MTDDDEPHQGPTRDNNPGEDEPESWDAADVLRARAAESRRARDDSVAELRRHLSDDELLDSFGIDLSRLEDEP